MKNNKLPLKERYNNFIQKHPKFWLTLIYCVLMLTLATAMLITALNPPDNKTASANYSNRITCPTPPPEVVSGLIMVPANHLWDKEELISHYFYASETLPGGYFTVSATLYRQNSTSSLALFSYRYLNYYAFFRDSLVYDLYLFYSNTPTIYTPQSPNIPADAMSLVAVSDSSKFPFYASGFLYHSLYNKYIANGIDRFLAINSCPVFNSSGGSCSPDDLKAEYDKGYDNGYDKGHTDGYQTGYNNGKLDGTTVDLNPISIFLEPVSAFMNIKLFGFVSLGLVFNIVLFVSLAIIFIRLFAGG